MKKRFTTDIKILIIALSTGFPGRKMTSVIHSSQIQEDGFADLCEAFRLY